MSCGQRLYWSRLRTRIRNRVHALLDRQQGLELPQCSDLFGVKGRTHLRRLELPEPDGTLLREDLALIDLLTTQIKAQEQRIAAVNAGDAATRRVQSIPGFGPILSALVATEIDEITRFRDADHLCAYAGLVPMTRASGGHTRHGPLLRAANRWLRWAFIEAAWVAIGLLGLLRHPLPPPSRSGQSGQYRHHHRRPPHGPHRLPSAARTTRLLHATTLFIPFPGRSACCLTRACQNRRGISGQIGGPGIGYLTCVPSSQNRLSPREG